MDPRAYPADLVPLVRRRYPSAIAMLEQFVNTDSGSFSRDGVNRMADICEAGMLATGWSVERLVHEPPDGEPRLGDLIIGRRHGSRPVAEGGRRVLLLAHMDTVFDDGTAAERPFRVEGTRAYGPGVGDDKQGIMAALEAVEVLCDEAGFEDFGTITLLCAPDEEIGSPFSEPVIRRLAAEHDVALGLEAARVGGEVVSARKGVAAYSIRVTGRAAHAGVHPERGVSAALEAAHLTIALQAITGRWPGVTCNVGTVRAGTRPNIVPERATLQVDLRAPTPESFKAAREAIREIVAATSVPGAQSELHSMPARAPWEKTAAGAELVAEAEQIAAALGFPLGDLATGGAADTNLTADCGVPTMDGLAPIGGAAHTDREWLDLDSVVPRITLLAALLARIGATE